MTPAEATAILDEVNANFFAYIGGLGPTKEAVREAATLLKVPSIRIRRGDPWPAGVGRYLDVVVEEGACWGSVALFAYGSLTIGARHEEPRSGDGATAGFCWPPSVEPSDSDQ